MIKLGNLIPALGAALLGACGAPSNIDLCHAGCDTSRRCGLLSDAAESVVNLVAALVALIALSVAARPADDAHPYGHTKAEYFSAAVEGLLIVAASVAIIWAAVERFVRPEPLENVGVGLAVAVGAAILNGAVALVLVRAGRRHRSITLEADGRHLLTDVWTTGGVVVAVLLVPVTGWLRLDPLIAFLVGCNIVWTGWQLIRRSLDGLLDRALPAEDMAVLTAVLDRHRGQDVEFHALRTREAGHRRFVSVHVMVPGGWTVQQGHDLAHTVEDEIRAELQACEVDTHIEPIGTDVDADGDRLCADPAGARPRPPGG
jgi:cation diffusion facilitator family transporter